MSLSYPEVYHVCFVNSMKQSKSPWLEDTGLSYLIVQSSYTLP